ncbi:SGNH/GDSL hydrolase family protein [Nocardioides zeae]|uniref:Lysophospholipase L1-like esterase n=1 Tax=Nocardioides zeae TaxID=1457234 RepID=A0AAJ1U9S7_9ACTN|nr:SGNH/GDSL hydrolase family protein [Nocardioides zeae]MDQ1106182.1 lysophospholipase L1-like esterase [Nocardioides zeae]
MAIHPVLSTGRSWARPAGRLLATGAGLVLAATALGSGAAVADPVSGSTGTGPDTASPTPGVSGSTSVGGGAVGAAVPAGSSYVALGDSYSSGTGTRSYLEDGTECLRSTSAFPSLLAAANGYALDLRACSGSVVADVRANQLGALGPDTDLVTLTIGGNDADFTGVITECALPAWASDCDAAVDGAQSFVASTLPARLSGLYAEIRAAAPSAEVVVAGYPRLFMGEDCDALTFFSPEEQARLNTTADQLNSRTSAAAAAAGFTFVDPTSAFTGHAVCDDPEWLNGLSNPVVESYHPNVAGHAQGYAPLVGAAVGTTVTVTDAVLAEAAARGGEQAALQAERAPYDRGVSPAEVDVAQLDEAHDAVERGAAPAE